MPRATRTLVLPLLVLALVATASWNGWIRVRRGDTLSELALRHGTTVAALRELNGIGGNNLIFEGQRLRIGQVPIAAAAAGPAARARTGTRTLDVSHLVVHGDSLIKIARRYGVSPDWIADRNKLPRSRIVRLGDRLVVGVRRMPVTARQAPAAATRVSKQDARALVVAEARRAGVDPHLAVALAVQESGLQQHVVSSVGAIGIMQVMPGTGRWVSRHLVGRDLDLKRAGDNVTAGVRYLALLLRITGNERMALAGYYQGLASVRRRGMYDDTKAYIANIQALRQRLARRAGR